MLIRQAVGPNSAIGRVNPRILANSWDGEARGNAVGAAVLLVELADGLGRAVAGKDPLSGGAADLPAVIVRKAGVGSGLAAVRRGRRVRAGGSQGGEGGEGNSCELHCEDGSVLLLFCLSE